MKALDVRPSGLRSRLLLARAVSSELALALPAANESEGASAAHAPATHAPVEPLKVESAGVDVVHPHRPGPAAASTHDLLPDEAGVAALGGMRKRCLDNAVAVGVLLLTLPLLVVIAVAIRATMGGPVLYRHARVGRSGREFGCLKFRTMVTNADEVLAALLRSDPAAAAEWHATQKLARDPRVTLLGRALRRTSLDELPQIFNVLRGDMSCVGPRPVTRGELARYGARVEIFRTARPGMTGLWQVSGRSSVGYEERVRLDCHYVSNWSTWNDFKILLRTVPTMLNTRQTS